MLLLMRKKSIIILLIFILGGIFRFVNLGNKPLWFDESVTYFFIKSNLTELFSTDMQFFLLGNSIGQWFIFKIAAFFDKSEFILRFPSFLFGTISVFLMYKLCKIMLHEQEAIIATLLFAIHPTLLWHSQDARIYSFLLFLQLLSTICVLDEKFKQKQLWWVILAIISIYSHIYAIVLIGLHIIYLYFHNNFKFKNFLIIAISSLPLVYINYGNINMRQTIFETSGRNFNWINGVLMNIRMIFGSIPEGFVLSHLLSSIFYYYFYFSAVLFIIIFTSSLFVKKFYFFSNLTRNYFILFSIVMIILLPILHDLLNVPYQQRYNIFLVPLGIIVITEIMRVLKPILMKIIFLSCLIGILLTYDIIILTQNISQPRPFSKQTLKALTNYDHQILTSSMYYPFNLLYYIERSDKLLSVIPAIYEDTAIYKFYEKVTKTRYFSTRENCEELKKFIANQKKIMILFVPSPYDIQPENCDKILLSFLNYGRVIDKTPYGLMFEVIQP